VWDKGKQQLMVFLGWYCTGRIFGWSLLILPTSTVIVADREKYVEAGILGSEVDMELFGSGKEGCEAGGVVSVIPHLGSAWM
jgi:hypothetical protein